MFFTNIYYVYDEGDFKFTKYNFAVSFSFNLWIGFY